MSAISYEVSIIVRPDLNDAFTSFMIDEHIPDLISTGAFSDAQFAKLGPGHYRASYTAASRDVLDAYLREHSSRLREDVANHFPEGLTISREEWNVLATF